MNVVLIVVDTLRADHLGCYGYHKPTSPAIDRFSAEGLLFEKCIAQGIPTTPAHTTLFTGLHPARHGIVCHGGVVDLDRKTPVLAERLQRAGYTTCAIDNLFDMKHWFARGFEFYINPSYRHPLRLLVTCEEINNRAEEWLEGHRNEKFFLFVHYWEPHTPYLPPERYRQFYTGQNPFDPEDDRLVRLRHTPFWKMWGDTWFKKLGPVTDPAYIESLYDGEIRHVDDGIASLLSTLSRLGLTDDTLIVLTSDHGEVMVREPIYFDHHGLYDDNIRVPLIVKAPGGRPGTRIDGLVRHTDITATILDAAGVKDAGPDGLSLLPSVYTANDPAHIPFVISGENTWQSKWSIRTPTDKLIVSRRPDPNGGSPTEYYDLVEDPNELTNTVESAPDRVGELSELLESTLATMLSESGRTIDPILEQEVSLRKN